MVGIAETFMALLREKIGATPAVLKATIIVGKDDLSSDLIIGESFIAVILQQSGSPPVEDKATSWQQGMRQLDMPGSGWHNNANKRLLATNKAKTNSLIFFDVPIAWSQCTPF